MVSAEYQGQGGYGRLITHALSHPLPRRFTMGFPSDVERRSARRHGSPGELGRMAQWVRWLRPVGGSRLRWTGEATLAYFGRAIAVAAGRPRRPVVPLNVLGPEVDELAAESRLWWPCGLIRDSAYLRWRWQEQPERGWHFRAVRDDGGRLRGLAVIGRYKGTGWIADLLAPDAPTIRALLLDAAAELRRARCALVTCWYNDPRPWTARAFHAAGFFARGTGPWVLHIPGTRTPEVSGRLDAWYLTAGDTDLV